MKLEGHLEKRSDWTRTWQKRYFVYGAGELKYYIDRSDAKPKGTIRIGKCTLGTFFSYLFETPTRTDILNTPPKKQP